MPPLADGDVWKKVEIFTTGDMSGIDRSMAYMNIYEDTLIDGGVTLTKSGIPLYSLGNGYYHVVIISATGKKAKGTFMSNSSVQREEDSRNTSSTQAQLSQNTSDTSVPTEKK